MTDSFDITELNRLATDLGAVAVEAHPSVRTAVDQSARATQDAWNAKLYTDGHAKLTGHSITHDITEGIDGVAADIGPKRGSGKQAGIVRLLENGSVHNAPHGFGSAALGENEADFEARLAFAVWAGQERHGL